MLIPAQSEAVLIALILSALGPVWLLWVVAILGNVLGLAVNRAMGWSLLVHPPLGSVFASADEQGAPLLSPLGRIRACLRTVCP